MYNRQPRHTLHFSFHSLDSCFHADSHSLHISQMFVAEIMRIFRAICLPRDGMKTACWQTVKTLRLLLMRPGTHSIAIEVNFHFLSLCLSRALLLIMQISTIDCLLHMLSVYINWTRSNVKFSLRFLFLNWKPQFVYACDKAECSMIQDCFVFHWASRRLVTRKHK